MRVEVFFDPAGPNNRETVTNTEARPNPVTFTHAVTEGTTYEISTKLYDKKWKIVWLNLVWYEEEVASDSWTFTVPECPKVNICHHATNHLEAIRVNTEAFDGQGANDHTLHGDFLYQGPVNPANQQPTSNEWCENNQPGDICSNLSGKQTTLPPFHEQVGTTCVEIDRCPNISGAQHEVPENSEIVDGNCVAIDICDDIEGNQLSVPEGHYQDGNNCPARTPVCTDPLARNYDDTVSANEIASAAICQYDNKPYCLNGQTGYVPVNQSIPEGATAGECPIIVDVCPNLDGDQTEVPAGYSLVEGQCVQDSQPTPTPTPISTPLPTPTPNPVASPTPSPAKTSGLEITALSCENRNFDVIIDLKENDKAASGVRVKFTYNNKTVEATTDSEGKARAGFRYEGDMSVKVEPEGDFPGHNRHVELPKDLVCAAGIGGGEPTGEVLGATTLAEAGSLEDLFFSGLGLIGSVFTGLGSLLYAKKKHSQI